MCIAFSRKPHCRFFWYAEHWHIFLYISSTVPLISQCIVNLLIWLQVLIPGCNMSENLKAKTIRDRINQLLSESFWTWRHMNTEGIKCYFILKQPLNETLQRNSNAVLLKPTLISLNLFAHCLPNLANTWNSLADIFSNGRIYLFLWFISF